MSNTIESQLTIHQIFEQQVSLYPKKIALVYGQTELTYNELNDKANQLANILLKEYKITPHETIAILSEPSEWIIISIIAILKIGCNYLPLSNRFPKERMRFMIDDSKIKLTLTQNSLENNLEKFICETLTFEDIALKLHSFSSINLNLECSSEDLAYVMYTSGTTGVPNGVEIPHRGVVRLVCGADYIPFDENLTFLQLSTFTFDASTFEIWGALLNGHKLVIYESQSTYFQDLKEVIETTNVNCIWLTSSLFNLVVEEDPYTISNIKYLLIGGESISPKHVRIAQSKLPNTQIINGYGPTESTTFATTYKIPTISNEVRNIPIGTAINETDIYILDENLQQVEAGEEGELYIGGRGLAIGYRNQPELTADRFIVHSHSSDIKSRLYKTGDLCRKNNEGEIEFIGRKDFQLKIRGFRIEIGEIEAALLKCKNVALASVKIQKKNCETILIAYITSNILNDKSDKIEVCFTIDISIIKDTLKNWLPDYMIPTQIVEINQMPLNSNGKIDKNRLPQEDSYVNDKSFGKVYTDIEIELLNIWTKIIKQTTLSIDDNFFEIGGFSLLGVRLLKNINTKFSSRLTIKDLYNCPTIRKLANLIDSKIIFRAESEKIIQLKKGNEENLFLATGIGGNSFSFHNFINHYKGNQSIYAFEYPNQEEYQTSFCSVQEFATYYIDQIVLIQKSGNFNLIGYSFGGRLVFEIAIQLQSKGYNIGMLGIIDSFGITRLINYNNRISNIINEISILFRLNLSDSLFYIRMRINEIMKKRIIKKPSNIIEEKKAFETTFELHSGEHLFKMEYLYKHYKNTAKFIGDILLFKETDEMYTKTSSRFYSINRISSDLFWSNMITGCVKNIEIDCNHLQFLNSENIIEVMRPIEAYFQNRKKINALST